MADDRGYLEENGLFNDLESSLFAMERYGVVAVSQVLHNLETCIHLPGNQKILDLGQSSADLRQ